MYGIGSLASQLLVSETTAGDMRHNTMKAFAIMRQAAIVVAEYLFVQITKPLLPLVLGHLFARCLWRASQGERDASCAKRTFA